MRTSLFVSFCKALVCVCSLSICAVGSANSTSDLRGFEVYLPKSYKGAVTGRILLMISRTNSPEVRFQVGWYNSPPVFGVDVSELRAGEATVLSDEVHGYPVRSLRELPAGDYYVQALLNVYTKFHRADGRTVWAHMDQWEGQNFSTSPGNLYSVAKLVHLEPSQSFRIRLDLSETIPPVTVPPDTEWVKRIKIQSRILSEFWGRPIFLGATVLLPRGYASHSEVRYPTIYLQGHFSLAAPFGFTTDAPSETAEQRELRERRNIETGYQFYQTWSSEEFPRMIAVTFQHPTPYYDDSYAVNSANNGPYGDAIMNELIPYIEGYFRIIRRPYARVLAGGSTGGWISLALELYHPEFFGGAWAFCPDPVDFRRYMLVNIYEDENAFVSNLSSAPDWLRQDWGTIERLFERTDEGQSVVTVRQAGELEAVLASRGRSGGVLDNWEAVYGPVADDGYPADLWDAESGRVNRSVAEYMRDQGYDLRHYAEKNWSKIGPSLASKLHIYCGDMDNFFLNLSVYLLEEFFRSKDPGYQNAFVYGRPLKGHGWQPMTSAALVREMAAHVTKNGAEGAPSWLYD